MTVDKTNDFQSKIKNRKIQFKRILRIFNGMEYQAINLLFSIEKIVCFELILSFGFK